MAARAKAEGRPGHRYQEPTFERVESLRVHRIDGGERLAAFGASSKADTSVLVLVLAPLCALLAVLWWLASPRATAQALPLKSVFEDGAGAAVMPLMNTASQVGFGAVITLLGICGLTHRQSCADVFVVAVCVLLLALVAVVGLESVFGSF